MHSVALVAVTAPPPPLPRRAANNNNDNDDDAVCVTAVALPLCERPLRRVVTGVASLSLSSQGVLLVTTPSLAASPPHAPYATHRSSSGCRRRPVDESALFRSVARVSDRSAPKCVAGWSCPIWASSSVTPPLPPPVAL